MSNNRTAVMAGCAVVAVASAALLYWHSIRRKPRARFVKVTALYTYPVKSIKAVPMEEIEFDGFGIKGDRRFMFVDDKGEFMTQRKYASMSQIVGSTDKDATTLTLSAPGVPDITVKGPADDDDGSADTLTTKVWGSTVTGRVIPEADEWLQKYFGKKCRLICAPTGHERHIEEPWREERTQVVFQDGYPQLIISEESMQLLNSKLGTDMDILRFRPNIVVSGCQPHEEDTWKLIRRNDVELVGAKLCARCAVPTIDPSSGRHNSDYEPIKTLRKYRKQGDEVMFGMNLINRNAKGHLSVGDVLEVVEWH